MIFLTNIPLFLSDSSKYITMVRFTQSKVHELTGDISALANKEDLRQKQSASVLPLWRVITGGQSWERYFALRDNKTEFVLETDLELVLLWTGSWQTTQNLHVVVQFISCLYIFTPSSCRTNRDLFKSFTFIYTVGSQLMCLRQLIYFYSFWSLSNKDVYQ